MKILTIILSFLLLLGCQEGEVADETEEINKTNLLKLKFINLDMDLSSNEEMNLMYIGKEIGRTKRVEKVGDTTIIYVQMNKGIDTLSNEFAQIFYFDALDKGEYLNFGLLTSLQTKDSLFLGLKKNFIVTGFAHNTYEYSDSIAIVNDSLFHIEKDSVRELFEKDPEMWARKGMERMNEEINKIMNEIGPGLDSINALEK